MCVCVIFIWWKGTHRVGLGHLPDLLVVLTLGQLVEAVGVQFPAGWVQLLPVIGSQLCSKGVDGYDKGSAISLKLHNASMSEGKREKKMQSSSSNPVTRQPKVAILLEWFP